MNQTGIRKKQKVNKFASGYTYDSKVWGIEYSIPALHIKKRRDRQKINQYKEQAEAGAIM